MTNAAVEPRDALEAFFYYVETHPYAWRMLFRDTTGDPAVAREHERILAEARAGIARQIARGVDVRGRGARRRLELLAAGVMGVTHGLALWWQAHPDVPRSEIVRASTDLLVPAFKRQLALRAGERPA